MGMMGSRSPFEFRISKYEPKAPSRGLIRCAWCGMSYDGNEHVNCPYCNAPRPDEADACKELRNLSPRIDGVERMADDLCTIFYADNKMYCTLSVSEEQSSTGREDAGKTCLYPDDAPYVTYDSLGNVVAPNDKPKVSETYGTVESDGMGKEDLALVIVVCIVLVLLPIAIVIAAISP